MRMVKMGLRPLLCYCIVVTCLIQGQYFGVVGSVRLSKKQELLAPHKHAVKTIKTQYGDIYDCVDFHKQPAFDHPLLKNHTFHMEMRPTLKAIAEEMRGQATKVPPNVKRIELDSIRLKDGGCPKGTVPLRRIPKSSISYPNVIQEPGTTFAVGQSKSGAGRKYYGVGANLAVFKPSVHGDPLYSSGEIIIQDGPNGIRTGWTVNEIEYKQDWTRFFVNTTVGGKACFNGECGFILVREDIPPDFVISPVSTRGGPIVEIKVAVYKDFKNGNWFLLVKDEVVGFWPSQIFVGGLADSGSYIACGGEVFIPTRRYLLPEMGAGYNPVKKLEDNAYCSWFNVVNENDVIVNADDTQEYANDPDTYKVWDRGYTGGDHGHVVLYGGGLR